MKRAGTRGGGRQYIHYDPERVEYAVTAAELSSIEDVGTTSGRTSHW